VFNKWTGHHVLIYIAAFMISMAFTDYSIDIQIVLNASSDTKILFPAGTGSADITTRK